MFLSFKKNVSAILVAFMATSATLLVGQTNLGLLPSVNVNKVFSTKWSLNIKAENRQQFGAFEQSDFTSSYAGNFFDITPSIVYKRNLAHKFAFGYLSRFRSWEYNQRFIQQYIHTYTFRDYKMGLRIVTDQTLDASQKWQFRLRWRNNVLLPLNGLLADEKEAYFKLNQELLAIHNGQNNEIEARLVPSLGWVFRKNNKLEVGADYRLAGFVGSSNPITSDLRLAINWYLKIH